MVSPGGGFFVMVCQEGYQGQSLKWHFAYGICCRRCVLLHASACLQGHTPLVPLPRSTSRSRRPVPAVVLRQRPGTLRDAAHLHHGASATRSRPARLGTLHLRRVSDRRVRREAAARRRAGRRRPTEYFRRPLDLRLVWPHRSWRDDRWGRGTRAVGWRLRHVRRIRWTVRLQYVILGPR